MAAPDRTARLVDSDTSDVGRERARITADSAEIETLDQLNVCTDNFVSFVHKFFGRESERADNNKRKDGKRNNRVLNETEAATRIQKLYRKNKKRAMQEILTGPSPSCKISLKEVQSFFENVYSNVNDKGIVLPSDYNLDPPVAYIIINRF